jgi:hypothetical protein
VAVVRTRLRALRKALHDAVANNNISSSEKARIERSRKDVKDKLSLLEVVHRAQVQAVMEATD